MSKAPKCQLPSGRVVSLTKKADPTRPWEVWECATLYELSRPRKGDSSAIERYCADYQDALLLDKVDAEALRLALTQFVSNRAIRADALTSSRVRDTA